MISETQIRFIASQHSDAHNRFGMQSVSSTLLFWWIRRNSRELRHFFGYNPHLFFEAPAMKTYTAKAGEVEHGWFVVDAQGKVLGKLATQIAMRLRGKHKPEYTPHVDTGDYVVVVNAAKVRVTGRKTEDKIYYRHSGYPGGLKVTNFAKLRATRPERVLQKAVKGMLPKGPLGYAMLRKLKVYAGDSHPHTAQQPKVLEIG